MSWKEVLKPSISELVERCGESSNEPFGDKLCCGEASSSSTYELVCVDEWLKSRTESMSSMDMDVSMAEKEASNLAELDHFLTPKGAVDLCESQAAHDAASLLLEDDDLLCKKQPSKPTLETPLFLVEDESRMKDEDGLGGRRPSWTEQLEKDKANWESMSNASHKSHELVKEVDFPEFNLVPPFDQICAIELPDAKELIEPLDKVVEPQERDPVMTCVHHKHNAPDTILISSSLETTESIQKEEDLAIIAISSSAEESTAQIIISTGASVFPDDDSKGQDEMQEESEDEDEDDEDEREEKPELRETDLADKPIVNLQPKSDDEEEEETNEEDEQPLIEALAAIGIKVDSLMYVRTEGQQRMWMCPVKECRKMYAKQSALKVHILSHYGLRPFKCDFEGCFWSFYTHFRLKRHKATHTKRKDFVCTFEGCGRKFTTVYNLNTHSKLHERPAENVCTVTGCDASFQTRRKLELHLKEHDSSHAPYRCHYCKRGYYSINSLNMHVRGHEHKEEEVSCQWPGCGKRFDKPCRLRAHMRSHTGDRPYQCTFEGCQWSFSTASKLRRHSQKHTDERNFKCPVDGCPKAFLRPEHLREHILTHDGTKNWECPVQGCEAKFTAKSSLYVHVKKHKTPVTKNMFACPFDNCKHKYLRKASLRHHMVKTHQAQPDDDSSSASPTVAKNFLAFVPVGGHEVLIGQAFSVEEDSQMESGVVLSTINPADIMLTEDAVIPLNGTLVTADDTNLNSVNSHSNLSNLSADESEDEGHLGCARTNLPLPLVPRKSSRSTNALAAPPSLLPDDIFNDALLVNPQGIEFQIMLDGRPPRDFAESTINLRDLE